MSFGLVAIPVSLYPATESKDLRFHLFDREGRRVRYRRVVEAGPRHEAAEVDEAERPSGAEGAEGAEGPEGAEGAAIEPSERGHPQADRPEVEVAYEDLVRGYQVEPEAFVFLEREDIERARPEPSRVIDLEHFVRLEDIDPIYFEKGYYVAPAPGAEKPYSLLLRTLQETGRVGIGRFVLRTKPHLVALRPMDRVLALETLYLGDEVRGVDRLVGNLGRTTVTAREVEVAKQLVEALVTDWDPSMFTDEYREELLRTIAERTPERLEEMEQPQAGAPSRIKDLMDALRRSVEEAKARGGTGKDRRAG